MIVIDRKWSSDDDEIINDNENRHMKISYTEVLRDIETAIEYLQQEKVGPTILLSFNKMAKHCCRKMLKNGNNTKNI